MAKLIGVIWTDIGTSQTVSYQITTANVHQFRVIATGIGGSTTSSVVSVNAGGRPVISITAPVHNEIYAVNESVVVSASIVELIRSVGHLAMPVPKVIRQRTPQRLSIARLVKKPSR